MTDYTLTEEIRRIVRAETVFLRHYWGKVLDNNDPRTKGRVKVAIPSLEWDTNATAPWCVARQVHSMVIPKVGEFVEVYFVDGDRNKAAWMGQAHEITGQTPESYTGPDVAVVHQDSNNSLVADSGGMKINGESKRFVTHAELNTALQQFVVALNLHVHGSAGTPPVTPMSIDISASETQTVKTGG